MQNGSNLTLKGNKSIMQCMTMKMIDEEGPRWKMVIDISGGLGQLLTKKSTID